MIEQKIILAAAMIYIAFFIASLVKFAVRKKISPASLVVSIFMPLVLLYFLTGFTVFMYKQDLKDLPLKEKILAMLRLLKFEIAGLPLIHTMVISATQFSTKEMKVLRNELTPLLGI